MSNRAIAEALGVSDDAVGKYRDRKPIDLINGFTEAFSGAAQEDVVEGDTRTISMPRTRIKTLEELIEVCEIDLSVWEVERFVANKWEMGERGGLVTPLFQVKAFLRKKNEVIAIREEIADMMAQAKSVAPTPTKIKRNKEVSGNLLEVSLFDVHFGKLAWTGETGDRNYDLTIAEAIYFRALRTLIERSKGYQYDEILFVVGNDLLNTDDQEGRTTKGTYVSTDGRYHKIFRTVRRVMVESIEMLRQIAPVRVIVIPGNHDSLASWHIGDSLECFFHKYEDVMIDNEPLERKYHQFGKVLLAFTHGDKGKRPEYASLMAVEQPVMFGETKFREIHTGHLHTTKLDEKYGVRVRILASLSPADSWHARNGFIGNLRTAEAFVWNREEGLIAHFYYTDDAHPEIYTKRELRVAA